jgi:hypothetical protein
VIKDTNWWIADANIKEKGFLASIPDKISRKLLSKNG